MALKPVGLKERKLRVHQPRLMLRWAAAAYLITEKSFRKIQGYRGL